jgi:hypothetical protein
MDNRQFNINGKTKEQLTLAVKCLLFNEYNEEKTVPGWYYSKKKGLVLVWHVNEDSTAFTDRMGNPKEVNAEELVEILWVWLQTDEAKEVEHNDPWDYNADHDGSNDLGWRLYLDEWGCVKNDNGMTINHYSIAAFKPAWLWYGK